MMHDILAATAFGELELPVQRHLGVQGSSAATFGELGLGSRCGACGGGGGGVQGGGGQHLGGAVDEVHGVHGRAVEFVEVEAEDVVVGVGVDCVAL